MRICGQEVYEQVLLGLMDLVKGEEAGFGSSGRRGHSILTIRLQLPLEEVQELRRPLRKVPSMVSRQGIYTPHQLSSGEWFFCLFVYSF